jgi:hypothetical protein
MSGTSAYSLWSYPVTGSSLSRLTSDPDLSLYPSSVTSGAGFEPQNREKGSAVLPAALLLYPFSGLSFFSDFYPLLGLSFAFVSFLDGDLPALFPVFNTTSFSSSLGTFLTFSLG